MWKSASVEKPVDSELIALAMVPSANDVFTFSTSLSGVDRGEFVMVVRGDEVDSESKVVGPRQLVSNVFTIDVNSCRLTSGRYMTFN